MLLEFLLELLTDFSPIYIYISVILSLLCAITQIPIVSDRLYQRTQFKFDSMHQRKVAQILKLNTAHDRMKRRNWLAIITKRIDIPDDDEPASSNRYLQIKKRGGLIWRKHLYSLLLGKQSFSFCLV